MCSDKVIIRALYNITAALREIATKEKHKRVLEGTLNELTKEEDRLLTKELEG